MAPFKLLLWNQKNKKKSGIIEEIYKVKKPHGRTALFWTENVIKMLKGHHPDEEIAHKFKNNLQMNLIKRLISQWWSTLRLVSFLIIVAASVLTYR